ncbi:Solute carrier family 22 member 10, partial [Exaiptasia diaphana]
FDLVCETAVYPSIVNSLIFLTMLFGAAIGSVLGDKFGRKTVGFPCLVFLCLCGLISAFAGKYWVFAVFRTLMGFGVGMFESEQWVSLVFHLDVLHVPNSILVICTY